MNRMYEAMEEMAGMDELASLDSPVHGLHPLPKLLLTVIYIFITVSIPKHALSRLIPLLIYPAAAYHLSTIPVRTCFYKLRYVLPLVCAVGIWNPLLDRAPALMIGSLAVSSGMISFLALLLKGILALMASFLLIASTGIEKICYALRSLKIPEIMVTQTLITYRYISLLLSETGTMYNAYTLRAPGQKGVHYTAWGSFLGQLLLRCMDRAGILYQSMLMRGFDGSFHYVAVEAPRPADWLWLVIWTFVLLILRLVPVAELLGTRLISLY